MLLKKLASMLPFFFAAYAAQAQALPVTIDSFESEVLRLVNIERAAVHASALQFDLGLQAAAEAHSTDMAVNGCFTHNSCDGTNWATRVRSYYSGYMLGENIAAGYTTPAQVVAGWMDSDGHRENILNPLFSAIGIGYVYQPGPTYKTYWTQDFGNVVAQPVPEPETYAMFLAGLGLLGIAARRRG